MIETYRCNCGQVVLCQYYPYARNMFDCLECRSQQLKYQAIARSHYADLERRDHEKHTT